MFRRLRPHVTFANVVACLALFVALGGTSVAAVSLHKNSVGAKQIKKGAVHNSDLAKNSVSSAKVKNRSLQALDFKAGQLPGGATGPRGSPGPRGTTGAAGSARAYAHVLANGTLDPAQSKGVLDVSAECDMGPSCTHTHAAGFQCFRLGFTPKSVVATSELGNFRTTAQANVGGPPFDTTFGGCPAGYTAALAGTFDSSTGSGNASGFYIAFN